ncbi:arsenosugar biosynthesis radical SAM (seleno)protein ArsS [Gordonibacter massiliensis (ex Traore et al. 2017)]|nr:arsenosugar biosynthesis radical SAM (seleno)protein ArsS [Gordonibacter massiliensis (ex Traore et al. 2017)]
MSSCSVPGHKRRVFKDAGRVCPVDYRLPPDAFAGEPECACDVLYVVGGLYGNPFALDAVDALAAAEQGDVRVVLNGDMHWFDKTAENFAALERRAARYTPLVGNVEAELRRQADVGVGCGCAYPDCTGDDAVSRSNRIHKKLSEAVDVHPELKELLVGRPATATVGVAGRKVAVAHGDEQLIGGWACSRESLQDVLRQDELDRWMAANSVDVLATTHTCAPAALALARGLVVNNGAAGLPNFAGQRFGLVVRVATTPHADALFGAERDGLYVECVPLRYDHDAYLAWFDELWPATSPAAVSYRSRIVEGADDHVEDALLGGFRRGPSARDDAPPRRSRATKDDVELALARLVYFEDVMDDASCLRTAGEPSTIQVNVTARCNLACAHCHVESGPHRTEAMSRAAMEAVLAVAERPCIDTVDVTGGAPEMHPDLAWFIERAAGTARVMVRTNLVILRDPAYRPLLDRYAELGVEVVASLPNVHDAQAEQQRGGGTFDPSIEVLRELNARGYGRDGEHVLDLVFNPQWPVLPPDQGELEAVYRRRLAELDVSFDHLFAVANNPIGRYGAHLLDTGEFDGYLDLLIDNFNQQACAGMMCRRQLSVGWDGRVYDCDFNQALGLAARREDGGDRTIFDYAADPALPLARAIRFRNHCYACTAGSGSSCGGTTVQRS